jgi:NADP-dependent 3-hydroxy acid dehydrogenase YdfG
MNKRIALVTNVLDYVGPPAVKSLLKDGYNVVAQDPAFQVSEKKDDYMAKNPDPFPTSIREPKEPIQHVWEKYKQVDVIVSNDTFPAIHIPIDEANVEDLNTTIDNVLIYPFKLMQAAIPKFKKQGRGNVIMITSCRTELPLPGGAISDIARAGLVSLRKLVS